jgi:hypothetical protein
MNIIKISDVFYNTLKEQLLYIDPNSELIEHKENGKIWFEIFFKSRFFNKKFPNRECFSILKIKEHCQEDASKIIEEIENEIRKS